MADRITIIGPWQGEGASRPITPEARAAMLARCDEAWDVVRVAVNEGEGQPSESVKALGTLAMRLAYDLRRVLAEREAERKGGPEP